MFATVTRLMYEVMCFRTFSFILSYCIYEYFYVAVSVDARPPFSFFVFSVLSPYR